MTFLFLIFLYNKDMEIAINFGNKGIVVEVGCGQNNWSRFFDCSVLSRYTNEEERMLFDHEQPLPFVSIFRMDLGHNYRGFVKALALLKGMCNGEQGILRVGLTLGPHRIAQLWRLLSKKFKIQDAMLVDAQNNEAAAMFCYFLYFVLCSKEKKNRFQRTQSKPLPEFVNELFECFCDNLKEVFFSLYYIKKKYKVLYEMFCDNGQQLDVARIVSLFPNATYLLVDWEVLSEDIVRNVLSMIEEGTSAKMNKIEFILHPLTKKGLSYSQCVQDYGSLFESHNWKMQINEESHHGRKVRGLCIYEGFVHLRR